MHEQDNCPESDNACEDTFLDFSTVENAQADNNVGPSGTLDKDHEDQPIMETLYTLIHDYWTKDNTFDSVQDF